MSSGVKYYYRTDYPMWLLRLMRYWFILIGKEARHRFNSGDGALVVNDKRV